MPLEVVRRELLEALAREAAEAEKASAEAHTSASAKSATQVAVDRLLRPSAAGGDATSVAARVRAYLANVPPAIAGQGGHNQTLKAAIKVGPGFGLEPEEAFAFLSEWNQGCDPQWSEKDLRRKISEAYKVESRRGWLLEADRNGHDGAEIHNHGPRSRIDNIDRNPGQMSENSVNSVNSAARPKHKDEEWDAPRLKEVIPAGRFPLEVYPELLRVLCREAAASIQCSADYLGALALSLAGSAVGMSVNLAVTSTWTISPHLYMAVVGPPGTRKSPALLLLAKPFFRLDAQLRQDFKVRDKDYQEAKQDYEVAKKSKAAVLPELPDPPILSQLTMDDTTKEAVAQVHAENPRGIVVIKDELTGWVASLNAYRSGKGDDKQFWMKCNTGALIKVNRKGAKNEPIVIPEPCVGVSGCLTPDTLPDMRDGARRDDGWFDRILFSYPDPILPEGWVEDTVSQQALDGWLSAIVRLYSRPMRIDPFGGRDVPYLVRLTHRAKEVWIAFFNAHCTEKRSHDFPPHLIGPWSKLEGFALRIALILSQLKQAYGTEGDDEPADVDEASMVGAVKLIEYFKVHFRRTRSRLVSKVSDAGDEADAILRWILRHELSEFTFRDISRNFPRFDEESRVEALEELTRRNIVRLRAPEPRQPGQRGALRKPVYDVNPHLGRAAELTKLTETPGGDAE